MYVYVCFYTRSYLPMCTRTATHHTVRLPSPRPAATTRRPPPHTTQSGLRLVAMQYTLRSGFTKGSTLDAPGGGAEWARHTSRRARSRSATTTITIAATSGEAAVDKAAPPQRHRTRGREYEAGCRRYSGRIWRGGAGIVAGRLRGGQESVRRKVYRREYGEAEGRVRHGRREAGSRELGRTPGAGSRRER